MSSTEDAIRAIRHVVQDHGDENARLGAPALIKGIEWCARILGFKWPPSYLGVLGKHDGVLVCDAILLSFTESFEAFLSYADEWYQRRYWPVAADGCGNYWVLALAGRRPDGECPILFVETVKSPVEGSAEAESYADFVVQCMARQCAWVSCAGERSGGVG